MADSSEKQIGYFKLKKMMLKFIRKNKHSRKILEVLSNDEVHDLPDPKMYCEALAIKVWCCEGKGWQLYGRLELEKIQTNTCGNFGYDKSGSSYL